MKQPQTTRKSIISTAKVERHPKKKGALKSKIKPISESALQSQCISWFRAQYPKIIIFAIPNAAKRSFRLAAKMKAEGMVSGIPDLFIAKNTLERIPGTCCANVWNGFFIEMKRSQKEKTTENQDYYLEKLAEAGYKTAVCRSFDEFQQVVNEYLE